jgi:hypothetical protein
MARIQGHRSELGEMAQGTGEESWRQRMSEPMNDMREEIELPARPKWFTHDLEGPRSFRPTRIYRASEAQPFMDALEKALELAKSELKAALLANREKDAEIARLTERIDFTRFDNTHPATHCLRLLVDFNISVGKACEFLSKYFLTGNLDPIADQLLAYDPILDEIPASDVARRMRVAEAELAALRAGEKWIDVKQELPTTDGRFVLVCRIFGHISYAPGSARWATYHPNAKGKEAWRDASGVKIDFTHWQPLPAPPSTDKES